ncbi:MAG: Uma2 family endonuclease [Cyanobacteria bacterium P01_D01_bin.123]
MQTLTFEVPNDLGLHVNPDEFAAIAAVNRDLRLERTADGELVVAPPTGGESGRRNIRIGRYLDEWTERYGGVCFDSSSGFVLPNGATRAPDAAWVSQDRWDALTQAEKEGFVPLCPDFAIELRSQSDLLNVLQNKMREYIDNGVRLGWLIDPKSRRVEIYRNGRDVETLDNPSQVSGEDVLPGFILDLQKVW